MSQIADARGILLDPCPPYTHELNGTAERYNRSIMNSARCLLADSNLPRKYWPEVIKTAAYLKNRTITNTIEKKTPFEILFKEKPNIKNFKLYGSKVFVRVPEVKRESKWDRKADTGILIGYERNGYKVLVDGKIVKSRHVKIVENRENMIGFDESEDNKNESEKNFDKNPIDSDVDKNENANKRSEFIKERNTLNVDERMRNDENGTSVRKSGRERKKPDRFGDPVESKLIYVNVISAKNPLTYAEALKRIVNGCRNRLFKRKSAVCDHTRYFTHYVGNVGSVHDSRVFRLSSLQEYINNPMKFPNNTHLIEDAAYALHTHLLVPYLDNGHLTQYQKNYNLCHSSTRMVIERAFALLKGRWRSLLHVLAVNCVDFVPYHILACCVLHNICLLQKDEMENMQDIQIEVEEAELFRNRIIESNDRNVAVAKRNNISANLLMRNT
ncbi:Copia protein [Cyphomyrmex costatus]|uniref:Copia protein n=1 Tax=Cyphomyrmex costatus TaxID=456900 RepID=A0A151IA41_9HYME|nr:Copia protein [Cyphomyrmex costatus]